MTYFLCHAWVCLVCIPLYACTHLKRVYVEVRLASYVDFLWYEAVYIANVVIDCVHGIITTSVYTLSG